MTKSANIDKMMTFELNFDAQLFAIRCLLGRQRQADRELVDEIEEVKAAAKRSSGLANERAVDRYVDLAQGSCYQDAAHSMAAVGMIVPFIESEFRQAFSWTGERFPEGHKATQFVGFAKKTRMQEFMPDDLEPTILALYAYRNKMFHHGLEWPSNERRKFAQTIKDSAWPQHWFSTETSGSEPWLFYMAPEFIDHCVNVLEKIVDGVEEFRTKLIRESGF